jgi:nucleoside-diphosphate-sugar epimerase
MEVRVGTLSDVESIRTVTEDIEIIVNLIGYCRAETSVVRSVLVEGMRNLLQVVDRARLQKFIFASNVAVYGHPKFEARLDEASPLKPDYPLGRLTVEAEQIIRRELPAVIVRVASVYGPGRDYVDAVRGGRIRLLNGGENWQSRIHVEDLAQVCLAAIERGKTGEVYLAGDDLPTTAKALFGGLAEALQVAPPLNLEVNAARAFGGMTRALNWLSGGPKYQLNENIIGLLTGNYFCVNRKIKQELGVNLKYPTFREAYTELLSAGVNAGK